MSSESLPNLRIQLDRLLTDIVAMDGQARLTASGLAAGLGVSIDEAMPTIARAVQDGLLVVEREDQCLKCGRLNGDQLGDGTTEGYADCGTCGAVAHQQFVFFKPFAGLTTGATILPKATRRRTPRPNWLSILRKVLRLTTERIEFSSNLRNTIAPRRS